MRKVHQVIQFTYLLLFVLIGCSSGAKILGIFPINVVSHFVLGKKLLKELATRGHDVTVISHYPNETPIENYTDISLEALPDTAAVDMDISHKQGIPAATRSAMAFGSYATEAVFNHSKIKELLKSNTTFDLVICELFFNHAHMAIAHHLKAPLILFSAQSPYVFTKYYLRHPVPFTYVPSLFSGYSYDMNVFQRMHNLFLHFYYDIFEYFVVITQGNEYLKKYMPNSPTVEELFASVDLVFYNSHLSTNPIIPKLPNMIEIGGFHVEERKPLPGDIQKFLDEATHGAIYFSMGSLLRSTNFKLEMRMAFLAVFGQLKERVLWKWEDDITELPGNVKIKKWLPQQDILAHANIKLFITHCGLSSVIETVHFGVPILGIPIFSDQPTNCAILKARGMGLTLSLNDISKDTLTETLNELLTNPKYGNNAKHRSEIMNDQEMKPMDRAIFWVEHILRHKGGKHLQGYGIQMAWYQFYMVDLIVIGLAIMVVFVLICYFGTKLCRKYIQEKQTIFKKKKLKRN